MKTLLILLLIVFGSSSIISQTGPGGVGNATSNVIWLEADSISSLLDGADITTWTDGSGNSNDVSQPTVSFKPIYKTGILNGLPVVRFNKTNGRLRRTGFASFPTTAITEIFVNSNSETNDATLSYASTGNNNDFLLFNSSNVGIYRGTPVTSGIAFNDNIFHITNASWRSSDGNTQLWKDGALSYSTSFQTGTSITAGGSLAIAGEQDAIDASYDAAQAHFGDFSEIMVFNLYLNTAQHIIVDNYLAAKYNLTISNDYFAYQGTHQNDVAGIGREDATNVHTAAMSANILQIENASGLDVNQEYLIFGHDDADVVTSWTTTEAPNAGIDFQRLVREWRLDETGDVGTVDFKVDVASFPALPVGFTMYALLIDSDGDFSSGSVVYELGFNAGTIYDAVGVNIADGDYVAIAAIVPKIQHTLTSSNDFEPNNASIEVSLNFISRTVRSVDFTTADGTALVAQPDYTAAAASTVSILAGNSTANYSVVITNDIIVESSETLTITLSNPSAGINLGTNIIHTYTILDDDDSRKVYFDLATSNGLESVSPVTINVSINNVDLTNPTTVDYVVTSGTATSGGVDFTLATGTVTFAPGVTTGSFSFTVNDDALYENTETIIISLANPSNCNVDGVLPYGGTGFVTHTYSILDNDIPPVIQFNSTASSGSEPVSPVSVQVDLDVVSGLDASATYTLTGTAIGSGTDYTLANGTVTIPAGSTSINLSLLINDDAIEELPETVVFTLTLPIDATLGGNTVFTYTIVDNDVFGYLGPGGVGKASNNKLWVKSNDLTVVADGTDITSWLDASGNSNDMAQGNASFTPRYFANIINSQPVVRFNQANGRLIHNSFTDFPTNEITTIIVNSNGDSGDGVLSYASTSSDNEYLWYSSNSVALYRGGTNVNTGTAINGSSFRIIGSTWQSSGGNTRFYRDGTQTYSGTLASGTSMTSGGNFALAGEQDAIDGGYTAGQSHQGDFSEVILYNVVLNSARRKIVDNYLSAKYNITIANDMFAFDTPGNYEFEVAGIGRDDINNYHTDAQGTAMVRINTPSSLDDSDYLIWGHDNATTAVRNTVDVPVGVDNRLERIWRVDETGNIGTVSVHFDLTGFTVGISGDLVLLIDSDDGVFINASQVSISSFASNIATFDNVNFSSGNWFTIASVSNKNPLPIELVSFQAIENEENHTIELEWQTASEINNDFFIIERSKKGIEFESLMEIEGAGTSNIVQDYTAIDETPYEGLSYYRLKQVDFDGNSSYSNSVAVELNSGVGEIVHIYPNPWGQTAPLNIQLQGFTQKNVLLRVSNIYGKIFYTRSLRIDGGGDIQLNDIRKMPAGTYLISIFSDKKVYNKQLIIH